ncbi:hypothetical protein ACFXC8_29810 [Streptomyces sp. NPDC059441]|uniref:hypothetical protein n=2 Tax=Streptomyces TaxID=1883 RepID=UPI002259B2A5|nr:hypothetical protein [Streptomyces sp. NBC_00365]MCX5097449.1 hypothetical protein [Streptomyces sp. NBC_00365]
MTGDNARSSETDRYFRVPVKVPRGIVSVLTACRIPVSDRLAALAADEEDALLSCDQLLELAGLVALAEWECEQAAGERAAADAGAGICNDLRSALEGALDDTLIGREVVVDDGWMMKDPDEDLERPIVHRGTITSWKGEPVLEATVMRDSGRPMTASVDLWTVTDRATRKVLFGMLS